MEDYAEYVDKAIEDGVNTGLGFIAGVGFFFFCVIVAGAYLLCSL